MITRSKKLLSLFLIFSLVVLSANLYAKEKRGAILIITKKNGQQIEGELITVKKDSLLLFTGVDVSVDISEIKVIKIVKKSKALLGALFGIPLGFIIGAMAGRISDEQFGGLAGAAIGIPIGLLYGGISGALAGKDKTIKLERTSPEEIKQVLDKLRKKARIRDYK